MALLTWDFCYISFGDMFSMPIVKFAKSIVIEGFLPNIKLFSEEFTSVTNITTVLGRQFAT